MDENSLDSALTAPFGHVSIHTQALCALKSLCTCVCQASGLSFLLYSSFALKKESSTGVVHQPPGLCVPCRENPRYSRNVGSQVFPWTLVSLLTQGKASPCGQGWLHSVGCSRTAGQSQPLPVLSKQVAARTSYNWGRPGEGSDPRCSSPGMHHLHPGAAAAPPSAAPGGTFPREGKLRCFGDLTEREVGCFSSEQEPRCL